MIFPVLRFEPVTQIGDKVRIDASGSFITPDELEITAITLTINMVPLNIFPNNFLDFSFSVTGSIPIQLELTNANGTQSVTSNISVLSAATDKLFSTDGDLLSHESAIYDYLPKGYSSFNHIHRSSQSIILDSLLQRGLYRLPGVPLVKENIHNTQEVRQWSKFLTLSTIFSNAQNEVGDIFSAKAQMYREHAERASNRAAITLDVDSDGLPDTGVSLTSGRLVRR
jgi:hypothetical protein